MVVINENLSKKDIRVLLSLFMILDGYSEPKRSNNPDPLNFKKIDVDWIGMNLGLSKREVKQSIENLVQEEIIEYGSNDTIKKGYRFCF